MKQASVFLFLAFVAGGAFAALPAGYQEVVYLKSTAGQYIDTGFNVTSNSEFRFKYSMDVTSTLNKYPGPFGTYTGPWVNCTRLIVNNGSTSDLLVYSMATGMDGWTYFGGVTSANNEIVEGYINATRARLNNVERNLYPGGGTQKWGDPDPKTMLLFRYNANDAAPAVVTIYYFKILETGNTVRDFVPCYRLSDGKTGMYDVQQGQFFPAICPNGGEFETGIAIISHDRLFVDSAPVAALSATPALGVTTGLVAGATQVVTAERRLVDRGTICTCDGYNLYTNADAGAWLPWKSGHDYSFTYTHPTNAAVKLEWVITTNAFPAGYAQVEYLKSTGGPYIDTGFNVTSNSEFRFKYSMDVIGTTDKWTGPFGTYTGPWVNCTRLIVNNGSTRDLLVYFMSTGQDGYTVFNGVTSANNEIVEGYINATRGRLNNVELDVYPAGAQKWGDPDPKTMLLFRYIANDAVPAVVTMYAFAVWEGSAKVHDYIMCRRLADNTGVVYDAVTGTFVANAGAGEFTCGPDIVWFAQDDTTYTWKSSVSAGAWDDPENWDAVGDSLYGFPAGPGAVAVFPEGATSVVTFAKYSVVPKRVDLMSKNLRLTFTGGVRTANDTSVNTLMSQVLFCNGNDPGNGIRQDNDIVLDGVSVRSSDYIVIGLGTHIALTNRAELTSQEALLMGYSSQPNRVTGSGLVDVTDGSTLTASHVGIAGGYRFTVANATFVAQRKGVFFNCLSGGGTVRLVGTNPVVHVTNYSAQGENNPLITSGGGGFEFCVPEGGYAEAPVRLFRLGAYEGDTNSSPVVVRIDPESPVWTATKPLEMPLFAVAEGVNTGRVAFAAQRRPTSSFLYATNAVAPCTWTVPAFGDNGKLVRQIGVRIAPRQGLFISIR